MAILARLAFHTPVTLDQVAYEGIERSPRRHLLCPRARSLAEAARRRRAPRWRDSVRVFPCFLYGGHPLAPVAGPFNAVMVEAPAITEVTMSGPGAGGIHTASAVLSDVVSIISGEAPVHEAGPDLRGRLRRQLLLLPSPRGRRQARRPRPDRQGARRQRGLGQERGPAWDRRRRPACDGRPRVPRVELRRRRRRDGAARRAAIPPRFIRVIEEFV